MDADCDLILPCRDEAAALRALLPAVPAAFSVLVVDNGSTDGTGDVARAARRACGRRTRGGLRRGRARRAGRRHRRVRRVHGRRRLLRPAPSCSPMLADVQSGRADLAVGTAGDRWPAASGRGTHALGNRLVVQILRRGGFPANDIAPIRVCRRSELLALDVQDRRFGYPVELMQKATSGGLADRRARRVLPPARGRHPLQGVRLPQGHDPDRTRLLARAQVRPAHCLIVAKAPVPGQAKTRLGAEVGMAAAADLAAAALLDTLDACRATFGPDRTHVALTGALTRAARGREIAAQLRGWSVFAQVGDTFADRLAAAHAEVGRRTGAPTVQIGMDTPQVTEALLRAVAAGLDEHDCRAGRRPRRRLVGARPARPGRRRGTQRRPHVDAVHRRADAGGAAGAGAGRRGRPAPAGRRHGRGRAGGRSGRRREPGSRRLGRAWSGGRRDRGSRGRADLRPRVRRSTARRRLPPGRASTKARCRYRSTGGAATPTPPTGPCSTHCVGHTLDVGCGPGRDERPADAARAQRARPRPRGRGGTPSPGAGRRSAPPQRLRPPPRRGTLGHRAAGRRQHRDRRRPGRAARTGRRAARARRSRRRRPGTARDRVSAPEPAAPHCRRDHPALPAGRSSASTRSPRSLPPPDCRSVAATRSPADGSPCWRDDDQAAPPRRSRLRLPAAQRRGHRPRRALARRLLRHLLRHGSGQPLEPARTATHSRADLPVLGLPGHPGTPRR